MNEPSNNPHDYMRVKYRSLGRPRLSEAQRLTYIQVGIKGADLRRVHILHKKMKETPDYQKISWMLRKIFLAGLAELEKDLTIMYDLKPKENPIVAESYENSSIPEES